jgi:hypothetical protein
MSTLNSERMGSRGGALGSLRRRYTVDASGEEAPEEYVAAWLVANSPVTIAGLVRTGFTLDEDSEIQDLYECEVQYSTSGIPTGSLPAGEVAFRFNFQAQGAHIVQSLETIASYAPSGETAPDFKGGINMVLDGGEYSPEGVTLDPPAETFSLEYAPLNAVVTQSWLDTLSSLCGRVNEYEFMGYPAGSLMLVRVGGSIRTTEDWHFDFGWAYIENDSDIPIGDEITVDFKEGFDLLWVLYSNTVDAGDFVRQPRAAYVERVYKRGDFDLLGLPALSLPG